LYWSATPSAARSPPNMPPPTRARRAPGLDRHSGEFQPNPLYRFLLKLPYSALSSLPGPPGAGWARPQI
jgi:hypothetical protein